MEEFVVLYHSYDLLVVPVAFFFFFFLSRYIARRQPSLELRNYFMYGMLLKMVATIIFGLTVQFYFGGGDTNRYYVVLLDLKKAINDDPTNLFHIYGNIQLKTDNPVAQYIAGDKLGDNMGYMVKTSNFMVPRFGLLFSYIFGNSFTALSMCYSFFAFWGCWKCFTVFASLYPHIKRGLAVCFLFFPSVVYWGSAITKDSICIGSLGLFVYSFYYLFFLKKRILLHLFSMFLWGTIMFFTKPYLLLSLLPALSLWFFLYINRSIKEKSLRYASFAVLLAIIAGSVMFLIQFMLRLEFLELDQYRAENLAQYAASSQLLYSQIGGSVFDIGTLDGSLGSLVAMFPQAVNITLFRPYMWEVSNLPMLLSAVESFFVFFLFLMALVKLGVWKFFSSIFNSPVMVFMFVYSIFLAGLVAITTNNFGSLVRYRIPAMPFFLAMLVILLGQVPKIERTRVGRFILSKKKAKATG